jgi:hypothetical protein
MAESPEITVAGMTLTHYAFVRAGLADGLAVEDLLGFLQLDAVVWAVAEEPWDERMLDAVQEGDFGLLNELDAKTAEARTHWTRRIPPYDEELRAWFAFVQAWQSHVEPEDYLRRLGLCLADVTYLHRLWSERMMKDAKVGEQALAVLGAELGEPPVPAAEPPRLIRPWRAAPAGDHVTADIPLGKAKTLPFAEGEPGPRPPPLVVPLPRRPRPRVTAPGVDETCREGAAPAARPLPFAAPAEVAAPQTKDAPMDVSPSRAVDVVHAFASTPSTPAVGPELPAVACVAPQIPEPTLILPSTREPLSMPVRAPWLCARTGPDLDASAAIRRATGEVIPFAEAFSEARPAHAPALTLEQHAALVAELSLGGNLPGLLARHGLTAEEKQGEDDRWARELDGDPSARCAWMRHFAEARERLATGGEER